jgi:hypothetical protein
VKLSSLNGGGCVFAFRTEREFMLNATEESKPSVIRSGIRMLVWDASWDKEVARAKINMVLYNK